MAYQRIMLKLSGEALGGASGIGIDQKHISVIAQELAALPVEMGIVVGGGNILRGRSVRGWDRIRADYAGMTATAVNAQVLAMALSAAGRTAKVFSAISMPLVASEPSPQAIIDSLTAKEILIFAGGLGVPGLSTDTTAAVRGAQMGSQVLLKATNVDGVYDKDPHKFPEAHRIPRMTLHEMLCMEQGAVDGAAVAVCQAHRIPIIVFDLSTPRALARAVAGEDIGTFVGVQ